MTHPVLADRASLGAVCIDMGSVVVDERPTWRQWHNVALQHLREHTGRQITLRELRAAIREGMLARVPRVSLHAVTSLGGDPEFTRNIWQKFSNRDRPLPYAAAALERLAARYPLVMVANQGLHARGLLELARLDGYFTKLLLSDEIGVAKPDERIFQMALETLNLPPERVAMLGDRLDLDIEPSRRLGMLAIRIQRGPFAVQKAEQPQEQPHLTFNSLTNAARWLAPIVPPGSGSGFNRVR